MSKSLPLSRRAFAGSACAAVLALAASGSPAGATVTTFDGGQTDGWGVFFSNDGSLGDFLQPAGGNPGANLQWVMVDTFGMTLKNDTNPAVLGDYSRFADGVTLGLDVKANSITVFGQEVPRSLVVELFDYVDGSPYGGRSVFYEVGVIGTAQTPEWTHLEVTIDDTTATALPAGWGGYGDEDPNTFEPILPPGSTFADVLANVDEIRFTTFVPGFFFGFTNFDVQFDNVSVTAVPEPSALALGAAAMALLSRRRR